MDRFEQMKMEIQQMTGWMEIEVDDRCAKFDAEALILVLDRAQQETRRLLNLAQAISVIKERNIVTLSDVKEAPRLAKFIQEDKLRKQ